jgi:hypothetical protein
METIIYWPVFITFLVGIFLAYIILRLLAKEKDDEFWLEDVPTEIEENLDLDIPPEEYLFEIDDGEGQGETECDWSVKYATAVDNTDNPTSWQYLKQALPAENECARYEVVVSSLLGRLENPDSTDVDVQVHYGTFMGFGGWWDTLKEYLRRSLSVGNQYQGGLTLGVLDYGPVWGQHPTPAEHMRSRNQRNGIATRSELKTYSSKMEFFETLTIKIKLEPGQLSECFPQGQHEFWGTAASSASASLAWSCSKPENQLFGNGCRSSAPADNSSPDMVRCRVGGLVTCSTIQQLSYEIVKPNDTTVRRQWNANGLGSTITADIAPSLSLSAGPLQLGQVSASFSQSGHSQSSNAGDSVILDARRGSATADEFVITINTYFDAELELQSDKDDDYNSSVSVGAESHVHHHMRIIGRTDADATCACCRPTIEFILGSSLVAQQPGVYTGDHAVIKIGSTCVYLRHPGWQQGTGWASPGTVRAWSVNQIV